MLTLAACFSKNHAVDLFWNEPDDLNIVTERFSLDISKVKIVENIFSKNYNLVNRLKESMKYDAIVVLSDGSIPLVWSKLFLHIQQPIVGAKYSFKDLIKILRVEKVFCNSL